MITNSTRSWGYAYATTPTLHPARRMEEVSEWAFARGGGRTNCILSVVIRLSTCEQTWLGYCALSEIAVLLFWDCRTDDTRGCVFFARLLDYPVLMKLSMLVVRWVVLKTKHEAIDLRQGITYHRPQKKWRIDVVLQICAGHFSRANVGSCLSMVSTYFIRTLCFGNSENE